MTWRRRLRELRGLFGLPVDGADAYMRKRSPAFPRRRRGLPSKAELVAGPGPRAQPPPAPVGPPPPFRPSRLRKYRPLLLRKAEALLERGSIVIETNGEPLDARILRFPDGTAVLETTYRSAYGSGEGQRRLEPEHLRADVVASDLEVALLNARVRPVAGQEV